MNVTRLRLLGLRQIGPTVEVGPISLEVKLIGGVIRAAVDL